MKVKFTRFAAMHMRYGTRDIRHIEFVHAVDEFGRRTNEKPVALSGWQIVEMSGEYEEVDHRSPSNGDR